MEVSLVTASPIPIQRVQHLTEVEKNEMVINGDMVLLTRSESTSPMFQASISLFPPWILVHSSVEIKTDPKSS